MAIREALGDVLFTTGAHQEAEAQLEHALSLAPKEQDVQHTAALICKLSDLIHWQGEFGRAIEMAESGLMALGKQIHSPEAANLLEVITRSYWAKEDFESARRYANQNAEIIRQIPYFDSIYKIYYGLAWVEMAAGNFQMAVDWLEDLEKLCLAHGNEVGLARCYHGLGDLWRAQNDFRQASQWLEKSLIYCERTGEAHLLMEGHLELAHHLILLDGDPSQIEAHIQQGMEIAEQMAGTSWVASGPVSCRRLGDAYLQKGDIEQALFYFRRAIEFGPPASLLCDLLCRLEQLYVQQGQREAFFDFCQRTRQQTTFQSQPSLRYWHLQPGSPSADYSQLIWWDSFEQPSLREEWHWMDSQGKSSYGLVTQQGILELRTTVGHSLSPTNPNAPRLLRQISGDFAVETRLVGISPEGEEECQVGGLLLWVSEGMYLGFGKGLSLINEVRLEVCAQGDHEIIGRGWLPGHQLYLRLERSGKSVSALCSNDGKEWQSCGETSFPVDDPVWIGLYVACPSDSSASVVRFKEFKLFQREAN
jgi:tetratricopeptide (TPR) repeat protein/regulation of enolase protein 1 (concanavalin A-like superfamily)